MIGLIRVRGVALGFAIAAGVVLSSPALAQHQPSPGALALAREVVEIKGASGMFDPLIPGVVERAKNVFLQTNPMLSRDLNDAATKVRTELAPRRTELINLAATAYAQRFTEAELKELLAFYKTPLGKKMLAEEPVAIDQSLQKAQEWANKLSDEVMAKLRVEMKKKGHNL